MTKMSNPCEDHGDSEAICGGDYILIFNAAARLDDSGGAGCGHGFKAVWEREEGVRGGHATLKRENGFHGAEFGGVHAAHLACADAESLAVLGIDDGVRFDMLANAPCKEQASQLLGCGRTPRDHIQFRLVDAAPVGVLEQ